MKLGRHLDTGLEVAIKVIKKNKLRDMLQIRTEVAVMQVHRLHATTRLFRVHGAWQFSFCGVQTLDHVNIVRLEDAFEDGRRIYLVSLMTLCRLRDHCCRHGRCRDWLADSGAVPRQGSICVHL